MPVKRYDDGYASGGRPQAEDTYDEFGILDEDAEVEELIESRRKEYHKEWARYVGGYAEREYFFKPINIIK